MSQSQTHQRILSIAFPYLPTDQIARRKWGKSWLLDGALSQQKSAPIIVTKMIKNAVRIVACEEDASKYGIHNGQSLTDARALISNLENFDYDGPANDRVLKFIALWCERYTPLIGFGDHILEYDYGLFLDITGCTHLFGGEEALIADMKSRLNAQGFQTKLCVADTPGSAWATARFGVLKIIESGKQAAALEKLPIAALRIEQTTVTGLNRLGLKTIGCIADLPRAPLATRFGRDLLQKLDQALGAQDETISPIMPVAELTSEKRFLEPIVYEDDIKKTIAVLAKNIVPLLEKQGLGARECQVQLFRVDGNVSSLTVQSAKPLNDALQIARLFYERIAALQNDFDAGFGFDVIRLKLLRADAYNNLQNDLIEPCHSNENYDSLIDRLSARLGSECVTQFALADTHIPERSFATVPVLHVASNTAMSLAQTDPIEILSRPIALLKRPEHLQTIAQVPDGPPIKFRWRKLIYEVTKSEGPERIACEWWRDGRGAYTRDYFKVEDTQGYRFWVFRHGLYDRETSHPNWYMHGLFS